jgi:hypothetical protein
MLKGKVVFNDGSWCILHRVNAWERFICSIDNIYDRWIVDECGTTEGLKMGQRVQVPLNSMKYFVRIDK